MRKLFAAIVAIAAFIIAPSAAQAQNVMTIHCKYSNTKQVDPIVAYGQAMSAHLHDFLGSPAVDQFSTADSLVGSGTTCKTAGDSAGYWFPTPIWTYANGRQVVVRTTKIGEYWNRPKGVFVKAPPHGMQFVAGNPHATSAADNPHLGWTCGDGATSAAPRDCTNSTGGSQDVVAELTFASCWDGSTAFDGQGNGGIDPSHFTYISGTKCPAGFVVLSKLTEHSHFLDPRTGTTMVNPFNADGQLGLSFSSGPYYTYHGDFLNGWDQSILVALIDGCVNKVGTCPAHG